MTLNSLLCLQEELATLQKELGALKVDGGNGEEDEERNSQIEKQYEVDKAKLHKMRLAIVSARVPGVYLDTHTFGTQILTSILFDILYTSAKVYHLAIAR